MYKSLSFLAIIAILTLFLAPPSTAQNAGSELVHRFLGEADHNAMGTSIASAYVDDDKYLDLIVGAHLADPDCIEDAGIVYVYSGEDGKKIWSYEGTSIDEYVGSSVARLGDTDGDGYEEFIVGAYGYDIRGNEGGAVYVFSFASGNPKFTLYGEAGGDFFGARVSGTGDVNGDGKPDILVGAPLTDHGGKTDAGTVYVYSGWDGAPITRFDGEGSGDHFGFSVAGAGDVDGDGEPDMVVGACYADDGSVTDTGAAYVYTIKTKQPLIKKYGAHEHDYFGWSVSGAGDVNNDGFDDVIVGIRGDDRNGYFAGAAEVYGIENAFWKKLHRFEGRTEWDFLGTSVAAAGDLDGDGHDDLIVGAEGEGGLGAAYLFRGKKGPASNGGNGLLICRIEGESAGGSPNYFGNCVAGVGDVDCDGCLEVAMGAYWAYNRAGCAYVYRCQPTLHVFKAGFDDDFKTDFPGSGRSEFSSVETVFGTYLAGLPGGKPVYEFDVICINKFFGHTFQQFYDTFDVGRGLPTGIIRGELEFRVRPSGAYACVNDTIALGYDRANPPGRFWSHKFADLSVSGKWERNQPAELFTLDLGALPDGGSGTSILSQIEEQGFLDVMIQDDTNVDFMTLRIWTSRPQNLDLTQTDPHVREISPVFEVSHSVVTQFDRVMLVIGPAWNVDDFIWASCFPFYFVPRATFFRNHIPVPNVPSPFTFDGTYTPELKGADAGRYITAQAVIADWSAGPTYWYLSNTITAPVF